MSRIPSHTLRRGAIIIALGGLALLPPCLGWQRYKEAVHDRLRAHQALQTALTQAQDVIDLRAQAATVVVREKPEDHVLGLVNQVLVDVGLPRQSLQSLRPEGDTVLPGVGRESDLRRQTVALSLTDVRLPDLGAFLQQWRESQSIWTPGRIELTKRRASDPDDDRYDVTMSMSAIYRASRNHAFQTP